MIYNISHSAQVDGFVRCVPLEVWVQSVVIELRFQLEIEPTEFRHQRCGCIYLDIFDEVVARQPAQVDTSLCSYFGGHL
jgi:hypothetical protein